MKTRNKFLGTGLALLLGSVVVLTVITTNEIEWETPVPTEHTGHYENGALPDGWVDDISDSISDGHNLGSAFDRNIAYLGDTLYMVSESDGELYSVNTKTGVWTKLSSDGPDAP